MDQTEKLSTILHSALEKTGAERSHFLREACGDNPNLLADMNRKLGELERTQTIYEKPMEGTRALAKDDARNLEKEFRGQIKVLSTLGEGGMGIVFFAEQLAPVRRKVALKLIKGGLASEEALARFEVERQALALMNHPYIAKIYNGGVTHSGRPYFVMEYFKGLHITEYCNREELTLEERLLLFIKVCQGVQHAHQKGIIHRDLKPSNVLVKKHDGRPFPKIIDFGIAKATDLKLSQDRVATDWRMVIGTPVYMSPEQLERSSQELDTRTDVYSLGVLLYEILVGFRPFEVKTPQALMAQILSEKPDRPSLRLIAKKGKADFLAKLRKTTAAQLIKAVSGELDCIVLKALEKNPDLRYSSPSELAKELKRYLAHEPVLAASVDKFYHFRKFLKRNRRRVLALTLVFLFILVGNAGVHLKLKRAVQARDVAVLAKIKAEKEQAEAVVVSSFLQRMLQPPDRFRDSGRLGVVSLVDEAAGWLNEGNAQEAEARADLLIFLGAVYENLGRLERAREMFVQARNLRVVLLGDEDPATQSAQEKLNEIRLRLQNP